MSTVKKPKQWMKPRLSFSALAKLMASHTPVGQIGILRQSKYPRSGPMKSYVNAMWYITGVIASGQPGGRAPRSHEQEVVDAFTAQPLRLPKGVTGRRAGTGQKPWQFQGVDISFFPDMKLQGPNGTGALKLHFNQDPLPRGVGKSMATLLFHYLSNVVQESSANAKYCLVYEVRSSKCHVAKTGAMSASALQQVRAACMLATAMWPQISQSA